MRSAFLLFCFLISLPSLAIAAEGDIAMPMAPWTNAQRNNEEIELRQLSLVDIEQVTARHTNATLKEPPSTLETLYSNRIIDELEQYGYDLFTSAGTKITTTIPAGAIQQGFILSAGDTLDIILRGQINKRNSYDINNQGLLIVEDLAPITAAGRTLKDIENALKSEIGALHNTQIFVSLSSVRQIGILVVGHVIQPGRKNLTSFHTVLDALSLAGGIQKTGSLRNIKLIRNGKTHSIDLYQLLMGSGKGADKLLQDGDRLIIPPIGPTIAIAGSVKRPAIYELHKNEKISLHQALGLGGGTLTPGQNRYVKLEYTTSGEETVQDINTPKQRVFSDGAILMVSQSQQKRISAVTLSGHTRQPGTHDLKKSKTLSGLITDEKVLGNDIYPLIGVIERRDTKQLTKKLIAFSPHQVLQKNHDQKLTEGDKVNLFSMAQIRNLHHTKKNPLLHKVSTALNKEDKQITDPILISFLKERSAFVRGAVRQAGAYPVTSGTTLESLLAVSGGIALEANKESIELTSRETGRRLINLETEDASKISIQAGDTVRVNQKFHKISEKSVMLIGEVNHPGRYDLSPGDTLSKLIARAGGLTGQAYPDGAIFSRASERKRETSRYKAQAQDLEMKLAASLQQVDANKKPDMTQVSATQNLIAQLKHAEAVGRITVEAAPASLTANPDQDILLESGDKIFIPKRPLTVRVAGEVLSPAALQFRKGKDPLDYIRQAGGTTYYADKDRTFVIYPDGSAQPLQINMWNHRATMIPPGSILIVPRDPKPFDFLESAERVSQILANLAISGLYVDAIGDDD